MSAIRAVLFDIDGTLLDSTEFVCSGFEHALGQYGFVIPDRDELLELLSRGLNLEECYSLLTDQKSSAFDFIETHRSFQEKNLSLCQPFPGALEVLVELIRRGYRLAAITTRSRRTSLKTLDSAGMLQYLDVVVSSEDVEYPKPHPDPVLRALAKLGVAPDQAIMVGDTSVDIESGRQAGASTVGVTYGLLGPAIAESGPDLVVSSLAEILEHLPHTPG